MIAFRKTIPDVFSNYFKLNPLQRSRSSEILRLPLTHRGLSIEDETVGRILDDLADCYSMNAGERYAEVNLTPTTPSDPFIELPALQVLADRLWRSRNSGAKPFSMAHYESLAQESGLSAGQGDTAFQGPADSHLPARVVLDGYLGDLLDRIPETPDPLQRHEWKELRIDCLYALTDKTRHRRAFVASELIAEANRYRPTELELPRADDEILTTALTPLIEARLIVKAATAGGEDQYELAHDFVVRSVVKLWRDLDHRRTGQLALQLELKREQEEELEHLSGVQGRSLRVMRLMPLLSIGSGLLYSGIGVCTSLPTTPHLVVGRSACRVGVGPSLNRSWAQRSRPVVQAGRRAFPGDESVVD